MSRPPMDRRKLVFTLGVSVTGVLVAASVLMIFLWAGQARGLGLDFKIFFFHVPVAWLMFLSAILAGVASAVQLARSGPDDVAATAGELAFVFGLLVMITGPIWAWRAWGKPWVWEPRLTTSLICWLTFAVAVLVRQFGGGDGGRLSMALYLLGAANVPVVYLSVKFWSGGHHPPTSVVPTLGGRFAATFAVSMVAFTILWGLLLWRGIRQRAQIRHVEQLWAEVDVAER